MAKITSPFRVMQVFYQEKDSIHANVIRLVEPAEYAHLRKLGHPREQDKLQIAVGSLKDRIETL